ncbi:lysylphosphatidylglycerol synthase transmembrane domain-containing protein [Salinibaculum rarum]|uniref:lysylphosphatidylglycerol synthase transmembrane domain-containing protein n=1 Tax=Salinibaculum rarum TaxID=3058903 RepID=UPI00265F52F6|nr:flippase-like domain-containing protein [Salinibaculum sp. KK48]
MNGDRLSTFVGFLAALVVLSVLVWAVGIDDVLGALQQADRLVLLGVVVVAAVWLSAWGLVLWTVLRAIGTPISGPKAVFVFAAAVFSNNVTPFGQAGGEPVSAMLISSVADSKYESGLAAIASVDTLHFVPSMTCAIVGFVYVVAGAARLTQDVFVAAGGAVLLVALIVTVAALGWRNQARVEAMLVRVVTPILALVARVVPRRTPPDRATVTERIEGFFDAVGRVGRNRRTLVTAMTLSAVGWVALSTSLWLSLYALGHTVPFSATLFVVPVGSIAGVTPLPGGLGGIETVFIALLVPTAGVSASAAAAAVLIHRGGTYWLPTLFGGGVAAVIGAQHRQ